MQFNSHINTCTYIYKFLSLIYNLIKYPDPYVEPIIDTNDLLGIGMPLVKNMATQIEAKLKVSDHTNFTSTVELNQVLWTLPCPIHYQRLPLV